MPKFNVNAARLKNVQGWDPLFGASTLVSGSPSTGSVLQNVSVNPPTIKARQSSTQSNPLGRALAGSRVRSGARGGRFAPRAVSGMR
jgi:hypothetical protein